jgi:hypothetical protein
MKKIITALTLSTGLMLIPAYLGAQDHHDDRYYDKHHKDYHQWNDHEDRAYHMYWEQHHHHYIDWDHANARQRQAYWNWRHSHSDAILKINIR